MKNHLQRKLCAWTLLAVFVPMLLLTSVHRHEVSVSQMCTECVQHIPHAGHWSQAVSGVDNCLLCQLHALSYLPVGLASLGCRVHYCPLRRSFQQAPVPSYIGLVCGQRAPPCKD